MTRRAFLIAGILLASCIATGCSQPPASGLPTVQMKLGSQTFTLEIANTAETRERGLMRRDSMPADHGMIFAFPSEEPQSFWMKNTLIPLDIVYIDAAGTIVSIRSMKPLDLTGIESGKPAKYAIELNAGIASAAGLKVGDKIKVPQTVTDAAK